MVGWQKRPLDEDSRVNDAEPTPDEPTEAPPSNAPTTGSGRPVVWGVFLSSLAIAVVFPAADGVGWFAGPPTRLPIDGESVRALLPVVGSGAVIAAWIFVFWSLIGSFLNVVVHRLPQGLSVVHGGSRCPQCHSPIKWYDNLPVVGWLNLNGRCRSCDLPIAARYPIVESICAGLCTAVYFRELISGGANLPGREPDFLHGGMLRMFPDPRLDLIGLYLYHCGTMSLLLAWGLIAWDGQRVPRRSVLAACVVATILPLVFPWLHPIPLGAGPGTTGRSCGAWPPTMVSVQGSLERFVEESLAQGLAVSVVGGLAGLLCGLLLQKMFARLLLGDASGRTGLPLGPRHGLGPPHALGAGLAIVGIVFGWQGMLGTLSLLLAACLVQMLIWSAVPDWPTVPAELLLLLATFVHLCAWRQLVEHVRPWWPETPTPACLVLPVALFLMTALAIVAITPFPRQPSPRIGGDPGHDADQST